MKNKYFLTILFLCASFALIAQTTVWKHEGDPADWQATPDSLYWTNGTPAATQKTVFNVPAMGDCEVTTDSAVCGQLVLGDNNPMGGALVIKDGGVLTSGVEGSTSWAGVGYNHSAHMVVETGGTFISNHRFHVGMVAAKADTCTALLEVSGTVDVRSNVFSIDHGGWTGASAICNVKAGGVINCPRFAIGPLGHMDVAGGLVIIKGVRDSLLNVYATPAEPGATPQLTAEEGFEPATITVYYNVHDTVTVISSSTSPEYVDPSLGINNKVVAKSNLGVYPNPATDVVQFKGIDRADVKVYSITGQLVLTRENVSELSVESLSPGLYFIEASAKGRKFVDKLLIK